jgi:hypothetical protein
MRLTFAQRISCGNGDSESVWQHWNDGTATHSALAMCLWQLVILWSWGDGRCRRNVAFLLCACKTRKPMYIERAIASFLKIRRAPRQLKADIFFAPIKSINLSVKMTTINRIWRELLINHFLTPKWTLMDSVNNLVDLDFCPCESSSWLHYPLGLVLSIRYAYEIDTDVMVCRLAFLLTIPSLYWD